ncbi:2-keto-myo-inositol dehydratase [Gemmobacter caeni]|uniref:2-keto-myo-inositol dehydratase n=1 Tax=Gemmobacter caeni TaxID=589035 RepID=A0A2T6BB37_9RHOB|nr:myo-inosose-2 dehydratase [Gemmobacter caeni]OJY27198.1 MAG: myo-inosose-2 dehydratase [Rhodobacterales bacterium 65-51]PTX53236.1 2-keto-myo-inositol dehydratase [Gemmobacter caeni]TWJ05347.1 2-keto-myo-inositol dehydratase [Gemmobacter caeni]
MIRFGTNPIAWANDYDPSIGAHIPTALILDEAGRQIGFDGIENGHRWPDDPEALRALLAGYGLRFVSGWYSSELLTRTVAEEIAAVQGHLAKLKHNGCKVCIVCETSNAIHCEADRPMRERPMLSAAGMRAFGARLEAFAAYLAGEGVTLVYHHHMGTIIETPEDIDALMTATGPHVQLLFDAGHCAFGGGDPEAVLRRHIGRVRHFHAKNIRPDVVHRARTEEMSFLQAVRAGAFTVPGDQEGGVDFAPLMRILKAAGYDGWIVIEAEQDPRRCNPLMYQTLGLATLKRLARASGLM